MGWFDGLFGQKSNASDPLQKLDPKLREFLEKESPVKYKPVASEKPQSSTSGAPDRTEKPAAASEPAPQSERSENGSKTVVPDESLFQDGRYAHLWKTYRPLAALEAEAKTDHEKLMDVLEAYKERKAQIGRTAMENCALEQLDWNKCMKSGDWSSRMTMCNAEVRKFERCFTMQSRLLRALGYLSSSDRSRDEEIQMHADKLYHRMLDQEAAMAKAKADGTPVPKHEPLIPQEAVAAAANDKEDIIKRASPEFQKRWKEAMDKVPEEDRAAEEAAIKAELRAKAEVVDRVQGLWKEQEQQREARKKGGAETISDKVSGLLKGSKS